MERIRSHIGLFVVMIVAAMCVWASAATAETITVGSGKTVDKVFTFGKDIRIYGTVEGDAVTIGGDIIIEPGGIVQGNAVSISGDVIIGANSEADGNAVSVGGDVIIGIDGEVGGDAVTVGGDVSLDRFGTVNGSIVDIFDGDHHYVGFGDRPSNIPGIFLLKPRMFLFGPLFGAFGIIGIIIGLSISLVKVLLSIAIAACITNFFPTSIANMSATAHRSFLKSFFSGLLMVFLIPFLLIGLVVTLIGIPLVPVFILFLVVCYLFGSVGVATWIGELFPNAAARSPMRNAIIGVLILALLKLIPGIGFLVGTLVVLLSFGLVLVTRFGSAGSHS